jgi:ABC-type multidrug transport system ATPase subunit
MPILSTKSLTKRYKDFTALNEVSINVEKGDIYGLI